MEKSKSGFTLIELLAIIVVLGIIMTVAIPIVLETVESAKKGAFRNTAYGIIKAAEMVYSKDVINGQINEITFTYNNGIETSSVSGKKLNYNGTKPRSGTINVNKDGKVAIAIHDGVYCAIKGYLDRDVTVSKKLIGDCVLSQVSFFTRFGDGNYDDFADVISVDDGYVVVGYSNSTNGDLTGLNKGNTDAIIVKYDLNGNVVWKKNYGGSNYESFAGVTFVNDGYVAVGISSSNDGDLVNLNEGDHDAIIVKYDLNGNILWKKVIV